LTAYNGRDSDYLRPFGWPPPQEIIMGMPWSACSFVMKMQYRRSWMWAMRAEGVFNNLIDCLISQVAIPASAKI